MTASSIATESPPSAMKSSSMPTDSTPSIRSQVSIRISASARKSPRIPARRRGRARAAKLDPAQRLAIHLPARRHRQGISWNTSRCGNIHRGSRADKIFRNGLRPTEHLPDRSARQKQPALHASAPSASERFTTATRDTRGNAASTASTSPGRRGSPLDLDLPGPAGREI